MNRSPIESPKKLVVDDDFYITTRTELTGNSIRRTTVDGVLFAVDQTDEDGDI